MSKKIFAMLIAVALFVVSAPMQVLAADEENKDVKDVTEIKVTVASIADDSATITWDKLEKADGYEVTCNAVTETIGSDVLSYTMKGLAGSTEYTAEVKAYDSKHNVVGNGKCTFTTMAPGTPDEVEGFDTISSYLSVHLQWNKSDDADGYKIYWSGDDDTSGTIDINNPSTTKYKFKIKEENREVNYTFKIAAVKNGLESMPVKKKDSAVQLMKLKITLRVNKVLQSHDKGKPATIKLKAGTTIKTIGFTNGKYVFQKKVKGKLRTFHVLRVAVKNPTINYIGKYKKSKGWNIVQPMYTKEEAEAFVNDLGVKSNTKHLIWVNQYSQRLYVFKGKKGSYGDTAPVTSGGFDSRN